MSLATGNIKDIFKINIKSRHDSLTDQYHRIFMVKLLLISSLVMGISWFQDSISCLVVASQGIKKDGSFAAWACWIQGVYVFKELKSRVDEVAYFGIPKHIQLDGMTPDGNLCSTTKQFEREPDPDCKPMQKTFYLQYQWMPFFIAALAVLYYAPYIMFRANNRDLISLKNNIKKKKLDAGKILNSYFNLRVNPQKRRHLRAIFNILVKLGYLLANLVALLWLDSLLEKEYMSYGIKWVNWSRLNNSVQFDYLGMRDFPKPGNQLLPPFGYCEVYELAKDIKTKLGNQHKFICELSQNILYQYCLMVLWFALIFGIVVSVLGLSLLIIHYIATISVRHDGSPEGSLYKSLTLREREYLNLIRQENLLLYSNVLERLKEDKPRLNIVHDSD